MLLRGGALFGWTSRAKGCNRGKVAAAQTIRSVESERGRATVWRKTQMETKTGAQSILRKEGEYQIRCKVFPGQFSGEYAVEGVQASGDRFSLFAPEKFVE